MSLQLWSLQICTPTNFRCGTDSVPKNLISVLPKTRPASTVLLSGAKTNPFGMPETTIRRLPSIKRPWVGASISSKSTAIVIVLPSYANGLPKNSPARTKPKKHPRPFIFALNKKKPLLRLVKTKHEFIRIWTESLDFWGESLPVCTFTLSLSLVCL